MKDKYLFILKDSLESYSDLFNRIKTNSFLNIEIIPFSSLVSDRYSDIFMNRSINDIAVAGKWDYINEINEKLNQYFSSIYKSTFQNIIYLYESTSQLNEKSMEITKNNCFLINDNINNISELAINFNLYMIKLFKEITTHSQLSGYIVDSFHDIADSEILRRQKKQIEKLNKELDKTNAEMMKELKMAQRVQQSIIPNYDDLPKLKELKFGYEYTPMENVGGDLLDIIRIGKNNYGFLIADVSGHGVPAALITTMAKVFFNSHTEWGITPGEVCKRVHDDINKFIGDLYYYLTAFYGIINLETSEFKYTNAGHQPAIIYRHNTSTIEELHSTGTLIGIFNEPQYETKTVKLEKGDRILIYTDGIIEAKNNEDKFYESERLYEYVANKSHLPPKEFVDGLIKDVEDFCGDNPPDDDRAILYIEFISDVTPYQDRPRAYRS